MTSILSTQNLAAAQHFLESRARHLELARFQHHFHGGSSDRVWQELEKFRNADGGFGRALEPDLRTPDSSALCSSIAFQILGSLQRSTDFTIVQPTFDYLLRTIDQQEGYWRIIPPSAEDSPHAPWWNQTDREDPFSHFSLNPTAEILGYLYDYQTHVSKALISRVTERVTAYLEGREKIEMHELLCCVRLFQTANLPQAFRAFLEKKLTAFIDQTVEREPSRWAGYSLRPLQVVENINSPFAAGLQHAIDAQLDYEIKTQDADGSWAPTWSWGESYPNEWALARQEWAGILTLDKLLVLHRFNRIRGT